MLVSIQLTTPMMGTCDSNQDLKNLKPQNRTKTNLVLKNDIVLCNYCKRTASNGIRCLGMCVADNDY